MVVISLILRWSFTGRSSQIGLLYNSRMEKVWREGDYVEAFLHVCKKVFQIFFYSFQRKGENFFYFPSECTVKTKNADLLFPQGNLSNDHLIDSEYLLDMNVCIVGLMRYSKLSSLFTCGVSTCLELQKFDCMEINCWCDKSDIRRFRLLVATSIWVSRDSGT
jgi:hypothetical protein